MREKEIDGAREDDSLSHFRLKSDVARPKIKQTNVGREGITHTHTHTHARVKRRRSELGNK